MRLTDNPVEKPVTLISNLPYRNLRDVLALHAKTAPGKTFMIYYDKNGERQDYSYAEFVARVHQVANLMYEDLNIQRGDSVATIGHNHSDLVMIYFACWIIGARVAPQNIHADDAAIAHALRESKAAVLFAMDAYLERAQQIIDGDDTHPGASNIPGIVQVGGAIREDYVNLQEAAGNRPITFLGDESGAKAADMPLLTGNQKTATLDDAALLTFVEGAPVELTQRNLLVAASMLMQAQALSGNQRVMGVLPVFEGSNVAISLITPLLAGGSVVLNANFEAGHFWERAVKERVSIVSVEPASLQALLDHATTLETAGDTLFGSGIARRDMTRFRHVLCGGAILSVNLARDFEKRFGFPVLYGYSNNRGSGFSALLPITLSWTEHQKWLHESEDACVGCVIAPGEMAIFDAKGRVLDKGQRGEIRLRGDHLIKDTDDAGWLRTGDEGFFKVATENRQFFFVTGKFNQ